MWCYLVIKTNHMRKVLALIKGIRIRIIFWILWIQPSRVLNTKNTLITSQITYNVSENSRCSLQSDTSTVIFCNLDYFLPWESRFLTTSEQFFTMASQNNIVSVMTAAVTRSSCPLDPRFISKHRKHYDIQELEVVKLDRTRINLYPTLGANTTDAEKTHSFNIAKAAFTSEWRISTEYGLVATASKLNCHT